MFTHSISAKPQQRPKNRRLSLLLTNFSKKSLPLYRRGFKSLLSIFFCFDFLHIDPSNDFWFCKFFCQRSQKWRREAESKIFVFGNGKNWQGSAKLSPLWLLPPPSELCNDENNSVIRSAMDVLRNSKKISLLAVAILFLFTFFNLILDAPRTSHPPLSYATFQNSR